MTDEIQSALLDSQKEQTPGEYIRDQWQRIRGGDLGSLPVLFGLIIIGIFFQSQEPVFLTPRNVVAIVVQMAGIAIISYGIVFVLLLGEIDLSVSYISAVGGVGVAILLRDSLTYDYLAWMDWWNVIPIALAITTLIGFIQGSIISIFQLPSFIVTLAGFLIWSGVVLLIIGDGGTVNIQNPVVRNLASEVLPQNLTWVVVLFLGLVFIGMDFYRASVRRNAGLRSKPMIIIYAQSFFILLASVYIAHYFNINRALRADAPPQQGMPVIAVIMIVLLIILTFVAENTRFGRYVYAIGGNKEAARRAGIRVERIRIIVFSIAGFMAGLGGIVLASRLKSVAPDAGGGDLLLYTIAAAVIGGTSLFGGRGKVSSALLGATIVASVENGMPLISNESGVKFVVTGLVLLSAVIVDALSRRRQTQSGLR